MAIQIFGHSKCKGTRAAQRFFAERRVPVQMIDITIKGPSKGELESVARAVGVEAIFDAQGARARDRGLQHAGLDKARMLSLMVDDPQLCRTPIVRHGQRASVGLDEASWKLWAAEAKQT